MSPHSKTPSFLVFARIALCIAACHVHDVVGQSHPFFQMGVLRHWPDSKCSGPGTPYIVGGLALDNIPTDSVLQMFPEFQCSAFAVSPSVRTIRLTDCASPQGFTVFDLLCLNEIKINRCGGPEVKPGEPWYAMKCQSDFTYGKVLEIEFGCRGPVGVIPVFLRANQCTSGSEINELISFQLTCQASSSNGGTEFQPGFAFYGNSATCSGEPSEAREYNSGQCFAAEDVAPPSLGKIDTDRGVKASCYRGPAIPIPVSYGLAEAATSIAVSIAIIFGMLPIMASSLSGGAPGVGTAARAGGSIGGGAVDPFAVLHMAQFISTISMMELPHAPTRILNFGSSLAWTMGIVPIVGTDKDGAITILPTTKNNAANILVQNRRLQTPDATSTFVTTLSGPEAYCARASVEPSMMFLSVFLVFICLQLVAALVVVLSGLYHKRRIRSTFLLHFFGLANPILYACFFPLFLSACFQLYLMIVGHIPEDAQSVVLTALAGLVIFILVFWATFLSLRIYRLRKEDLEENRKVRVVYRSMTARWRFSYRLFWLANLVNIIIRSVGLVFVRTYPTYVQPAILLANSVVFFILWVLIRPLRTCFENFLGVLIMLLYAIVSLIPVVFAIDPMLFTGDTQDLLEDIQFNLQMCGLLFMVFLGGFEKRWLVMMLCRKMTERKGKGLKNQPNSIVVDGDENDNINGSTTPKVGPRSKNNNNRDSDAENPIIIRSRDVRLNSSSSDNVDIHTFDLVVHDDQVPWSDGNENENGTNPNGVAGSRDVINRAEKMTSEDVSSPRTPEEAEAKANNAKPPLIQTMHDGSDEATAIATPTKSQNSSDGLGVYGVPGKRNVGDETHLILADTRSIRQSTQSAMM